MLFNYTFNSILVI